MKHIPRQFAGLSLLFLLGAQSAWACYAPPREQFVSVDQLIADAGDIAVVKVTGATPREDGQLEYQFLVLERLMGPDRSHFSLVASKPSGLAKDTSFASHDDPGFWAAGGGRLMTSTGCRLHPAFAVGASYLLFGDRLGTHRSAEKIEALGMTFNRQDKWLLYVEATLGKRRRD